MCSADSVIIRTDVTSVKLYKNEIFAGIGGYLNIYNKTTGEFKEAIQIFNGQKIYDVVANTTFSEFLIYGGKELKIFSHESGKFTELTSFTFDDWLLQAKWVDHDDNIATILMHNIIILWSKCMTLLKKVICEERCLLYSACLINDTWNDLIVLSGTVFSEILIWWPQKCEEKDYGTVLSRLTGHQGVIFSIDYSPIAGLIASSSDDRSVRLWEVPHKDLRIELALLNISVSLNLSLFGHSSRVFKCRILNTCVISAGEDSLINVWDFNGNLLRKIEAHQTACIWSLDCSEQDNLIVSGGGDCGVTVFPLQQKITVRELEPLHTSKKIAVLEGRDIVSISEDGQLEYYSYVENTWTTIMNHEDLKSYALLEVSFCRTFVALAGFYGTLHVYQTLNNTFINVCSYTLLNKSRIFAFHWLSDRDFLTCGLGGALHLWSFDGQSANLVKLFNLPPSKERWTTAACKLSCNNYVVGDRKGNIFLYSKHSTDPIQVIKKAHNYLGVTYLQFKNTELLSLGRNSVIRKYNFDEINQQLSVVTSDKLPFSWLCKFYEENNLQLILAFLSTEFLIWDYKSRRTLVQYPCGGGHRSWDFYKSKDSVMFVYIKEKRIICLQFDWHTLYPNDIINGYHISEINSIESYNFDKCHIVVSGGEDTTLRIAKLDEDDKTVSFRNVCTFKSHLSSIRVVKSHLISCSSGNHDYLIVSTGGRAQIVLWKLSVPSNSSTSDIICSEKFSYHEQTLSSDSETRIMDICIISLNKCSLLVAACSDGFLKLFLIFNDNNEHFSLILIGSTFYALRCILKVTHLSHCFEDHLVVSMATDGKLVFWNFSELISSINDDYRDSAKLKRLIPVKPIHCVKVHQSGINSFHFRLSNCNRCLFLSGGDDNTVFLSLLEIVSNGKNVSIRVKSQYSNVASHCAQITGVVILDKVFLTTSIDQKLNIFVWNVEGDELTCDLIQTFKSSIADIKGMQCHVSDNLIYVYLYGKGIEIVRLNNLCKSYHGNPR